MAALLAREGAFAVAAMHLTSTQIVSLEKSLSALIALDKQVKLAGRQAGLLVTGFLTVSILDLPGFVFAATGRPTSKGQQASSLACSS